MLIHPVQVSEQYPIGSIIESNIAPSSDWLLCNGQLLLQSAYSNLYNIMDDPHPIFQQWELIDSGAGDYFDVYKIVTNGTTLVGSCYGSKMIYSTNYESWTAVTLPTASRNYYTVAYNSTIGLFLAVPYHNSLISLYATSPDGVNWTERNLPATVYPRAVTSDDDYFYILTRTTTAYRSSNGVNWTAITIPDTYCDSIIAANDLLLIFKSNIVYCSSDQGATWKSYDHGASDSGTNSVSFDADSNKFIVCSGEQSISSYSVSEDGIYWELTNLVLNRFFDTPYFNKIKKVGNYWFLCTSYSSETMYSSDLKTWNKFIIIPGGEWNEILYNSSTGYYYFLGEGRYIMRWKEVDYDTNTYFQLPYANDIHRPEKLFNINKYIRVK